MVIDVTGCCCVVICIALGMVVGRLLWLIVRWLWLVMFIWFDCWCLSCVSDCDTVVFCVVLWFWLRFTGWLLLVVWVLVGIAVDSMVFTATLVGYCSFVLVLITLCCDGSGCFVDYVVCC